MSIINNAGSGNSIPVLSTIDRYLKAQSGNTVSLDMLKQNLRPETLPKTATGADRYDRNLDFWLRIGLWKLEDNKVSLEDADKELTLEHRVLKKIIENTSSETQFFNGTGVEPFSLCITGLINQNQYSFAGGSYLIGGSRSNLPTALLQYANLNNENVPNQSNESGPFLKWAQFLGFVEPIVTESIEIAYCLDPTRAILPYLTNIFANKKTLDIQEFLQKLAHYLPMFGEGRFVKYLEPLLNEPDFKQANNLIFAALSHALFRLEAMNKISFEQKSDDINAMQLYVPEGITPRSISTVTLRDIT